MAPFERSTSVACRSVPLVLSVYVSNHEHAGIVNVIGAYNAPHLAPRLQIQFGLLAAEQKKFLFLYLQKSKLLKKHQFVWLVKQRKDENGKLRDTRGLFILLVSCLTSGFEQQSVDGIIYFSLGRRE